MTTTAAAPTTTGTGATQSSSLSDYEAFTKGVEDRALQKAMVQEKHDEAMAVIASYAKSAERFP